MTGTIIGTPPGTAIVRLADGGRIWALGAVQGDDGAIETLGRALLARWRRQDNLVVLGNMLGNAGDPARTLDLMLRLRRRLMAIDLACSAFFLRGAQEEMWHKVLALQFAMSPLDVFDWMLEHGLAAVIGAYGATNEEGRVACRNGPSAIARWTNRLRARQAAHPGHAELLNTLQRAATGADGRILLSAAGVDAARPIDEQADAFWWNGQSDTALAANLAREAPWQTVTRVVRGTGAAAGEIDDAGRVLTVSRDRPALVALDGAGTLIERIEG
jgi:hypothetical protein